MKIFGVDFTSVPSSKKPITCAQCRLDENGLSLENSFSNRSFDEFENFLQHPGPWVAGMDFPFGQPRKLIENMGWPQTWEGYVRHLSPLTKKDFDTLLKTYRDARPFWRQPRRKMRTKTGGVSYVPPKTEVWIPSS